MFVEGRRSRSSHRDRTCPLSSSVFFFLLSSAPFPSRRICGLLRTVLCGFPGSLSDVTGRINSSFLDPLRSESLSSSRGKHRPLPFRRRSGPVKRGEVFGSALQRAFIPPMKGKVAAGWGNGFFCNECDSMSSLNIPHHDLL